VIGFASSPNLTELANLSQDARIPLYEDAGSGQLNDLSEFGIEGEPIISSLIAGGADIVSFSGDKLLGSIQSGMIVGRRGHVDRLRRHPLYRALRADKIRLAALEATLNAYVKGSALNEVPVLQMLAISREEIAERCHLLISQLDLSNTTLKVELVDGESAIGGGAGPDASLPTTLLALTRANQSAQELEALLRGCSPPIIARISEQKVLIDLRTVSTDDHANLVKVLNSL
jgi:L-seryl-tRNA(Ser) seleniumtransferase